MDVRTGRIYRSIEEAPAESHPFLKQMMIPPTAKQTRLQKVGRNELCPSGSGKKFKRCCMSQEPTP